MKTSTELDVTTALGHKGSSGMLHRIMTIQREGDEVECLDCFFFFQAEDGIRDDLVTGVQTCALPIYPISSNGSDQQTRAGVLFYHGTAPRNYSGLRRRARTGSYELIGLR